MERYFGRVWVISQNYQTSALSWLTKNTSADFTHLFLRATYIKIHNTNHIRFGKGIYWGFCLYHRFTRALLTVTKQNKTKKKTVGLFIPFNFFPDIEDNKIRFYLVCNLPVPFQACLLFSRSSLHIHGLCHAFALNVPTRNTWFQQF